MTSPTASPTGTGRPAWLRWLQGDGLLASRPLLGKPPLFDLRGLAIGNGLTDPAVQVREREGQ